MANSCLQLVQSTAPLSSVDTNPVVCHRPAPTCTNVHKRSQSLILRLYQSVSVLSNGRITHEQRAIRLSGTPKTARSLLGKRRFSVTAAFSGYMKRSKRSLPALQTGQTSGGCGLAHRYPQTLQRQTGNASPATCTCSISPGCTVGPPAGRRSGMDVAVFSPRLIAGETYSAQ